MSLDISLMLRCHESSVVPPRAATQRYSLDRWNRWQYRKEAQATNYAVLLPAYGSGDLVRFFEEVVRLKVSGL